VRLTIFGATGRTGRPLIEQALQRGHQVTAVVRDPAKLSVASGNLDVVQADVFDAEALKPALDGADAALSALGIVSRKDTTPVCYQGTRSILQAMSSVGTRRIVVVSAQPVLRTNAGNPAWFNKTVQPILRSVFHNNYADLERMERVLADSSADWTVIRAPYLVNKKGKGRYRLAVDANMPLGSLARADLAKAMLDVTADPATIRRGIGIGVA
jgi:putative NADH-flavin reductase